MDARYNQQHPLPAPPGPTHSFNQNPGSAQSYNNNGAVPQKPALSQAQTRRSRAFSYRSEKSNRSSGSNHKIDLHETSAEKEAKRLHSKADPTLAMNEAEPSAVAATVKSQLASLRNMQHKDTYGNPIAEPDLSNPTRSRWERPLDTIRSFEAAIDGAYSRKSYIRSDSESVANYNRRGSYYANPNNGRFPHDSYYSSRPPSMFRADSGQYDPRQANARDSYYEPQQQPGYGNGYSNGPPPVPSHGRRGYPRVGSEPQFNNRQEPNVYPIPSNHRSYETVASASGSGTSGEPAGYQTDPTSSDNSSIDRMQVPMKRQQELMNDYGPGFNQNYGYQPPAFAPGARNYNGNDRPAPQPTRLNNYETPPPPPPPAVPQKGGSTLRKSTAAPVNSQAQRPAEPEKRKSWIARKLSRKS